MSPMQRDWLSLTQSASQLSQVTPIRTRLSSISRPWRGAIATLGGVLLLSACSAPAPNAPTESPEATVTSERAAAVSSSPDATSESPEPGTSATPPLRADDIRAFLEQGSIEDSSQCPSKSVIDTNSESLQKVAYFETTHYWIEICSDQNGALEYYGRKRDQPDLDLAIAAYAVGDSQKEFSAQNGNTVYQINATELVVTQNGVPIIREPVVRSSLN